VRSQKKNKGGESRLAEKINLDSADDFSAWYSGNGWDWKSCRVFSAICKIRWIHYGKEGVSLASFPILRQSGDFWSFRPLLEGDEYVKKGMRGWKVSEKGKDPYIIHHKIAISMAG